MAGLDSGDNSQKKALDQTPPANLKSAAPEAAKADTAILKQNDAATSVPAAFGPGKVEVGDAAAASTAAPGTDKTPTLDEVLNMSDKAKAASDTATSKTAASDTTQAASSAAGAESATTAKATSDSTTTSTTGTAGTDATTAAKTTSDTAVASTTATAGGDATAAAKTTGDASVANAATTKDTTVATAKDTPPALSARDQAVKEFTEAGGNEKKMPDGSTQYIDKSNHLIGLIYPKDTEIQHYKWDGDQLVGIKANNYEMTRTAHKDGSFDQWQVKGGDSFGMNVTLDDKGTMTWRYEDGRTTIAYSAGNYNEFQKDRSWTEHTKDGVVIDHNADGKTCEHTKDKVDIWRQSDGRIISVTYPPTDKTAKQTARGISYSEKEPHNPISFTSANGSMWLSDNGDGLHWRQVNADGTPNYHVEQGKKVQASMTGLVSFAEDGKFNFYNVSGVDKNGKPEAPHLTAYDQFGKPVPDTANKDNFHSGIAKLCQDYIKANGGKEANSSAIEKTLASGNAPCEHVLAAQFLKQMLPKAADNPGVEPAITLESANTWLAVARQRDDAAIAVARALADTRQQAQQAQQQEMAAKNNAPEKVAQAAAPQAADQSTQQPEVAKKDNTTPEVAQKVKEAAALTQDEAVNAEHARVLAKQAKDFFDLETGSGKRALSRDYLQKIAADNADANQSEANYLLQLMPANMFEINQDFMANLLANPRVPSKNDATQSIATSEQQPKQ
jgi:hypothetical protein